ncbi:N-carbamoylputrescine amidase [Vitis vinifera]|uniref:N-carbamoylputrescine amidase n=1 Tax=Vitis vinifera TaxID=29760 RepID=A0A438HR47_VITVI|nr:N-carbamoylputrescine amidase [Vitis vinifera]
MAAVGREVEKREGRMEGNRVVVVSALQFACTDDVPTNLNTAERLVRDAHRKGANIILIQWSLRSFVCFNSGVLYPLANAECCEPNRSRCVLGTI